MSKLTHLWKQYGMWFLLLVIYVIFSLARPKAFFTWVTFTNILKQASVIGTCAVGVTMIMISGAIDISVGPRVCFIAILCAYMMLAGWPVWLVVVLGVLLGGVTGALNAIFTEIMHTYVFVVTIVTMNIFTGLNYVISAGRNLSGFPAGFKNITQYMIGGKLPMIIIVFIVMVLIGQFIMNRTMFGRKVYAIGGNREAAHLAGINVVRCNILVHFVGGLFIGMGAILMLSRQASVSPNAAGSYAFDCITAACLGGIVLSGGQGTVSRAALGILVIYTMFNGLTIVGVNDYWQQVIKGGILLLAIGLEVVQRYSKAELTAASEAPVEVPKEESKV